MESTLSSAFHRQLFSIVVVVCFGHLWPFRLGRYGGFVSFVSLVSLRCFGF